MMFAVNEGDDRMMFAVKASRSADVNELRSPGHVVRLSTIHAIRNVAEIYQRQLECPSTTYPLGSRILERGGAVDRIAVGRGRSPSC